VNGKAQERPWRRGPAQSNSRIPISARSSVPLNPRGPAIGFFTPARYADNAQPGNVAPVLKDVPISAYAGSVKKGKGK
jgi:hypothetical protein